MPASYDVIGWLFMLAFWCALFVPGFAFVRCVWPEKLSCGVLTVIALSYLCSLAILSPLLIACTWLHLPLSVFSAGIVVSVLAASGYMARHFCILNATRAQSRASGTGPGRAITRATKMNRLLSALCAAVVVADLILSALYGGYLDGDSAFHVARIRMLLDHGFNNWDPYLYPHQFSGAYHTNIYHALIAAASQISGQSFVQNWSTSLVWSKLVIVASQYYLGHKVFQRRIAGWIAAVACTLWPYNALPIEGALRWIYLVLPHNIAPLWLFPLMIAGAMDVWSRQTWKEILQLSMIALVICEMHMLYGAFFCCLVAPIIFARTAYHLLRKQHLPLNSILLITTLLIPVPFLWISRMGGTFGVTTVSSTLATQPNGERPMITLPARPVQPARPFNILDIFDYPAREIVQSANIKKTSGRKILMVDLSDGRKASDLRPWWNVGSQRFVLLIAMLLVAAQRLRRAYCLMFMVVVVTLIIYHPTILTWFIERAKVAPWAIARMDAVFAIAGYVLVPNAFITLVSSVLPARLAQLLVLGVMLILGLRPRAAHNFEWDLIKRRTKVVSLEKQRGLLKRYIPPGQTVFADVVDAKRLIQLHNVYVIAANRMSPGLLGAHQRKADVAYLWRGSRHPWRDRANLLRYYQVTYAFSRTPGVARSLKRVLKGRIDILHTGDYGFIIAKMRY